MTCKWAPTAFSGCLRTALGGSWKDPARRLASDEAAAQVGAVGVQLGQEVAHGELDWRTGGVQVQPVDAQQGVPRGAAEGLGRPVVGERHRNALLGLRDGGGE